jgi:hypothetical protein
MSKRNRQKAPPQPPAADAGKPQVATADPVIVAEAQPAIVTKHDMLAQGFHFISHATCGAGAIPGCKQHVELWQEPKGLPIYMNPMPEGNSPWQRHDLYCPAKLNRK